MLKTMVVMTGDDIEGYGGCENEDGDRIMVVMMVEKMMVMVMTMNLVLVIVFM